MRHTCTSWKGKSCLAATCGDHGTAFMSQTILIVDDDPVQRRLLENVITKAGYQVLKADSGSQAIKLLQQDKAGAIKATILDLVMPEIDGMEVMQKMIDLGITSPVIVQTAQGS